MKTSKQGTKENETRATFIVEEQLLLKIKAMAKKEGFSIKSVVNESFKNFITKYEKAKGDIDISVLQKKSIF